MSFISHQRRLVARALLLISQSGLVRPAPKCLVWKPRRSQDARAPTASVDPR